MSRVSEDEEEAPAHSDEDDALLAVSFAGVEPFDRNQIADGSVASSKLTPGGVNFSGDKAAFIVLTNTNKS